MNPLRLYIQDFMCYSHALIDFSQFKSALIVGKIDNNDLYSNGVGKTTIFKAIEYVLFNQAGVNLDKIIRDDTQQCCIVLDFTVDSQEYRVFRIRTNKGSTDLTLLKRKDTSGDISEIYHNNDNIPIIDSKILKNHWQDISGRRATDTEKQLSNLLKINYKAFRNTIHFVQNDFGGLSTLTAEKRKGLLKEVLDLVIYSKLEKLTKDNAANIQKNIDKNKILIEKLGNPRDDIKIISDKLVLSKSNLLTKQSELLRLNLIIDEKTQLVSELTNSYNTLTEKFSSLLENEKNITADLNKIKQSIVDYKEKQKNIDVLNVSVGKDLVILRDSEKSLSEIDFSEITLITDEIENIKKQIMENNVAIKNIILRREELSIPLSNDAVCKHCRQPMTEEHRKVCSIQINKEISDCATEIGSLKAKVVNLTSKLTEKQQSLSKLNSSKKSLADIINSISLKEKYLLEKNTLMQEYILVLSNLNRDADKKNNELLTAKNAISSSSIEETSKIKEKIVLEKTELDTIQQNKSSLNKEIFHLNNSIAVMEHDLDQKNKDENEKTSLKLGLQKFEKQYSIYPTVIQAFSSTGIPNIIIQNVLDDLQTEANNLLSRLKPGLQLSFIIEKTKSDGDLDDTLDIKYTFSGKNREYDQLSGAMKLSVLFSLKLGLAFLLKNMFGTDIKLLLLDEIDQSLDKASVDAFSDIVKLFQDDFTILVITHNDRLKDKFAYAVQVSQDMNMISTAQVVSSW